MSLLCFADLYDCVFFLHFSFFHFYSLQVDIDAEVKILLSLKVKYKAATGVDYKPGSNPPKKASNPGHGNPGHGNPGSDNPGHGNAAADALAEKIKEQGDKVRNLKSKKAPKVNVVTEKPIIHVTVELPCLTYGIYEYGHCGANC